MVNSANFLSFESVEFDYPGTPVLSGLSLSVGPGEVVGFLGVNGAGKTTTFFLAAGIHRPKAGRVELFGEEPAGGKKWAERTGVLFSGGGLYPRLTVRRHLHFFAALRGLNLDVEERLKQHGLSAVANKKSSQLSHGFKRKLALACATIHDPELLLLDEPSDGLDPGATEDLQEFLKDRRESGCGVLLTSHRLEEVERVCDRIVLLSQGRAIKEGAPGDLQGEGEDRRSLREIVLDLHQREGEL